MLVQTGQVGRGRRRVGVLGPEQVEDLGIVPVPQPQPVVHPAVAVGLENGRAAGGRREAVSGGPGGSGASAWEPGGDSAGEDEAMREGSHSPAGPGRSPLVPPVVTI